MKKIRLTGPMGSWIQKHLALRRSLGYIYQTAECNLDLFDQYLLKNHPECQTITREMIVGYIESRHQFLPSMRSTHISNLRQFCRFMFQFDTSTYIPEKGLLSHAKSEMIPHIFTEEEIVGLITQASKLHKKYTLLPHTYTTIIGLLWVTGMRIGEVVHLKIGDIDTSEGIIIVRQTKFFKSRLIPLSPSTTQALISYKQRRVSFGYSEDPETPFFFNERGKPCIVHTISGAIRRLMIKAGIRTIQGKTPRVYDLRHSFATRWFFDFYQSDKDPTVYLPILATYMGHANIANTQVYLHPSIELLNLAGQKLHSYILSTLGEKK